jgi:hypothetical protein
MIESVAVMAHPVPSFSAKITRAKRHIDDLEAEINRYIATKPYTVSTRIEGKKKVRRLAFTGHPADGDIPVIAADAIYNLRSSLDHLMSSVVASKRRGKCYFPVYFQGVWEPSQPGENAQRLKERGRWASDTRGMKDGALTVLKKLQPPDDGGHDQGLVHAIRAINKLSNRDRHEKLPVVATGLSDIHLSWTMPSGLLAIERSPGHPMFFLKDETKLPIPDAAVDVQIEGTPRIAIRLRDDGLHIELPDTLRAAADIIETSVIPDLSPFVR